MLYHGTTEKYLQDIITHGLRPRGVAGPGNWEHSCNSHPDAVYLSNAYALYFAHAALKDSEDHSRLMVLEIDDAKLQPSLLCADEDALEQMGRGRDDLPKKWDMKKRNEYYKTQIEHVPASVSLSAIGNCTYLGTIPTNAINRVALIEQSVYYEMMMRGYDPTITVINYRILGERYKEASKWIFEPASVTQQVEDWGIVKTISLPITDNRDGITLLNFAELLPQNPDPSPF